jgi:hypothetical protein
MAVIVDNIVTCDICGRLFKEVRKRYFCTHCKKYYYVCPICKEIASKCSYCGISLMRKSEPVINKKI